MSIGVAIIGSGIFAREEHLPAVEACSNLTLKAIYSRTLKSAQALHTKNDVDLYSDDSNGKGYEDLLSRPDIHAVIIALPIPAQPSFIKLALRSGKQVLSEKPIAKDLETAKGLIEFYGEAKFRMGKSWGVAENFRWYESFLFAKGEVEKLGRILGFGVQVWGNTKEGGKWIETPWRKVPEYQGGFLLDGGIHSVAGLRLLLGPDHPVSLSAYTSQLRPHLPPVDTVNSIWKLKSGVSGSFCMSFGTTLSGSEFTIACEKGSVTIKGHKVTVREGEEDEGKFEERDFSGGKGWFSGVGEEIKGWEKALVAGKEDPMFSVEQALGDLEILEGMLRSGEREGEVQNLRYQV